MLKRHYLSSDTDAYYLLKFVSLSRLSSQEQKCERNILFIFVYLFLKLVGA